MKSYDTYVNEGWCPTWIGADVEKYEDRGDTGEVLVRLGKADQRIWATVLVPKVDTSHSKY